MAYHISITVSIANESISKNYKLTQGNSLKIGRASESDFVIPDKFDAVSRLHVELSMVDNSLFILSKGRNGTILNSKTIGVNEAVQAPSGNFELNLGSNCVVKVEVLQESEEQKQISIKKEGLPSAGKVQGFATIGIAFQSKNTDIIIGRSSSCDIIIDEPMVSRNHARLFKVSNKYYIEDLCSSNGTFVDGERITTQVQLSDSSIVYIGPAQFKWGHTEVQSERAIEANMIYKKWGKKQGLYPLNFSINKGEFVALMGPSGCGKSTLLKLLSKYIESTGGTLLINGDDIGLKSNWGRLKHAIGYVDQNDESLIPDLSVMETMFYAAKLRLHDKTSEVEIDNRINRILNKLNLSKEHWNKKISQLSGGQRKRVSIGVELISEPQILFLDEPTSPLDPESINMFLSTIKQLSKDRAVLMVTHKPDDLLFVDRVLFLGTGGYHVFSGTSKELLSKFGADNILSVYEKFSDKLNAEIAYKKLYSTIVLSNRSFQPTKAPNANSFIRQYFWSCVRYLKAKKSAGLVTIGLISTVLPLFAFLSLSNFMIAVPFMIIILSIFVGLFNGIEEILYDRRTFDRERKINMRLTSYYLSKVTILSLFGVIQALLISSLAYFRFKSNATDPIGINHFFPLFLLSSGLCISAMIIGLFISSVSARLNQAVYTLLFVIIVQIIFAGTFTKLDSKVKESISYLTLSRWGMQAFAHLHNNKENQGKLLNYGVRMDTLVYQKAVTNRSRKGIFSKDTTYYSVTPSTKTVSDTLVAVHPMKMLEFYPEWNFESDSDKVEDNNSLTLNSEKKAIDKSDILLPKSFQSLGGAVISIFFLDIIFASLTLYVLGKKREV